MDQSTEERDIRVQNVLRKVPDDVWDRIEGSAVIKYIAQNIVTKHLELKVDTETPDLNERHKEEVILNAMKEFENEGIQRSDIKIYFVPKETDFELQK